MSGLPVCMTIAGSDSGAGAGIQADLKTFASLGCYGTSVITALTAQNTMRVNSCFAVPANIVRAQIQAILSDYSVSAIKIGMVYSNDIIKTIAEELRNVNDIPIILDPVLISTSGKALLEKHAIDSLKQDLFPITDLLTPNIPELKVLTNSIGKERKLIDLGKHLLTMGVSNVLIKGGHTNDQDCKDYLIKGNRADDTGPQVFSSRKIITNNTHGTGCTLSSGIAAYLALNYSMDEAVKKAKEYVTNAIIGSRSWSLGKGKGPLNHFFKKNYENSNQ